VRKNLFKYTKFTSNGDRPAFKGSCALSVQANRRTPFANRRMKFYPRTITETQRARWKRNSLAATSPGV
jgi:hypothetical protein